MAEIKRNFFHVMPVVPPMAGGDGMLFRWKVTADHPTLKRLGPTHPDYSPIFCRGKEEAIREGRAIARRNEPSELIWHRHPQPGETGYPIAGRNTYPRGSDPKKSKG